MIEAKGKASVCYGVHLTIPVKELRDFREKSKPCDGADIRIIWDGDAFEFTFDEFAEKLGLSNVGR